MNSIRLLINCNERPLPYPWYAEDASKNLSNKIKSKGLSTEILREPGSTVTGEKIRDILLNSDEDLSSETELLLMFSARAQLIKEKIINSSNDFILFDRFFL